MDGQHVGIPPEMGDMGDVEGRPRQRLQQRRAIGRDGGVGGESGVLRAAG